MGESTPVGLRLVQAPAAPPNSHAQPPAAQPGVIVTGPVDTAVTSAPPAAPDARAALTASTLLARTGPQLLVASSLADLPAKDLATAQSLTVEMLSQTRALANAGLDVDPNTAATGARATTTKTVQLRSLAAALFGTSEANVSDGQLAALRARNPGLLGESIPAGTPIVMDATPAGLDLAEAHLRLLQATAPASAEQNPELQRAIAARLEQVTTARRTSDLALELGRIDARLAAMPAEQRASAIAPAFERLRRTVAAQQQAGTLGDAEATRQRVAISLAEADVQARTVRATAEAFIGQAHARDAAEQPAYDSTPVGIVLQMNANDRWRPANSAAAIERMQTARDNAIRRLEEARVASPADAATIDQQITRLRNDTKSAIASTYVAAHDIAAAERSLLPAALTRQGSPTTPDGELNVGADGQKQDALSIIFAQSTHVGALSDAHLNELVGTIAALPVDQQREAMAGLTSLGDVYAAADDQTRFATTTQLLHAAAERLGDDEQRTRALAMDARFAMRVGNFQGARQLLDGAAAHARAVPGEPGKQLQLETIAGMVAVHRAEAASSADEAGDAAAMRLRTLRMSLQSATSPLSRDQQARLVVLESQTFLDRHDPERAIASLDLLEAYRDVPWAAATAEGFRRDHSESGVTAALKVGLRMANSGSTGLMLGSAFGGGALGAGVGFVAAGPAGAGVGFLVGSAAGSVGASAAAVAQRWDRVSAAFSTGMTSLSTADALTDGAFAALNLASVVPPIAGATRVAQLAGTSALIERAIAQAGPLATRQAIQAQVSTILANELMSAAAGSAKPISAAGAALLGTQVASAYIRVESMPPGPERERARAELTQAIARGGLLTAAAVGSSSLIGRIAASSGRRWPTAAQPVTRISEVVDVLQDRATPIAPGTTPVTGAARRMNPTHYLRTADIDPAALPYSTQIRPARPHAPQAATLAQVPVAPVARVTDTVLASNSNNGSAGYVRLAELADGTPVAIKTSYPTGPETTDEADQAVLKEARALQLQDELGFGPRFHGIVRDGDRYGLVMDLVPGDFEGTPINAGTFHDIETIIGRLRGAGITHTGDALQLYRSATGNILAIDATNLADLVGVTVNPPNGPNGSYTGMRLGQLAQADPAVGVPYLDGLRTSDPDAYQGLLTAILSYRNNTPSEWTKRLLHNYADYAEQHRAH